METAFLHFSEESLKILQLAQEAARELGHSITGSEHLLLGILSNQQCHPTQVLLSMGVTYKKAEEEVLRLQSRNQCQDTRPYEFTPRAKSIIQMSVKANERTESSNIEPEDLFIAILMIPRCTARKVIHALDIDEELILTRLTTRRKKTRYSDTTIDQLSELYDRIQSGSFGSEDDDLDDDAQADPMVGYVIDDKYKIEEVLGRGGMGVVYKVKHQLLERDFAVKILHPYLASDSLSKRRFQREAQAASRLTHPNIATVFDWDVLDDGRPYLVMYYIEGIKLSDLIGEQDKYSLSTWISILIQICDALGHAHEQGVIHRDLKPGNILLSKSEKLSHFVKIVDFGIAKILHDSQDATEAKELTKTGEVFGSPLYMSPEQCLGQVIDNRSDIYALGCVMYEILTGLPPFYGESLYNTMRSHVSDPPQNLIPCTLFPDLPLEMEEHILMCLSKNPEDRPESMDQVRKMLEKINQGLLK